MVIEYPYDVDLDKIAKSGQCFRLRRNGMYYQYGPYVVMQLGPKKLWVEDCVESVFTQTESRNRRNDYSFCSRLRRCAFTLP